MSASMQGGIIGAALGAFFGPAGAQVGWTIGSMVGPYILGPDGPDTINEGPRLTELKVLSSAYGVPIYKVYGAYRIAGNVIWSLPIAEVKHETSTSSGKGGGSTETQIKYSYEVTCAIAFCEGPVDEIRKIWVDSVLVWSYEPNDMNLAGTITSDNIVGNISIYTGTSDQDINWTMQSTNIDSPAYRNTVYIIVEKLQLEKFGNRIPNITAEIVRDADIQGFTYSETTAFDGTKSIVGTTDSFAYIRDTNTPGSTSELLKIDMATGETVWTQTDQILANDTADYCIAVTKGVPNNSVNYIEDTNSCPSQISEPGFSPAFYAAKIIVNYGSSDTLKHTMYTRYENDVNNVRMIFMFDFFQPSFLVEIPVDAVSSEYPQMSGGYPSFNVFWRETISGMYIVDRSNKVIVRIEAVWNTHDYSGKDYLFQQVQVMEQVVLPIEHSLNYQAGHLYEFDNILYIFTEYYLDSNKRAISRLDITTFAIIDTTVIDFGKAPSLRDQYIVTNIGITCIDYNRHIVLSIGDEIKIVEDTLWDSNYWGSVDYMTPGGLGISSNTGSLSFHSIKTVSDKITTTLEDVLIDLSVESGLTIKDFDYSAGSSQIVTGYLRNRTMSCRATVQPLLDLYNYNVFEKDFKIILEKVKSNSIVIIEEKDLIHNTLELTKPQELDLLKTITIKFANKVSDYQIGIQRASRVDTKAISRLDIDYAVVLSDSEAKNFAEKLLYLNWVGSTQLRFETYFDYKYLNPGDIITLDIFGNLTDIRLNTIQYTSTNTILCEAVFANNNIYSTYAEAQSTSENGGTQYTTNSPTYFDILDTSTLDNSLLYKEIVYGCLYSKNDNWGGGYIYTNTNDVFSMSGSIITNQFVGTSTNILGSGTTYTIDYINTINITTYNNVDLYSITKTDLTKGYNYIILGSEILQYQIATDNGNGTYTLSNLLRGRRGTEKYVDTHTSDELLYALTNNIIPINQSINTEERYYSNSFGLNITDNPSYIDKINTGQNLKPFKPVYIKFDNVGNDIKIKWHRRSRYISGYLKTLPIAEQIEQYKLRIYRNNDLLRTEYIDNDQYFIYTENMQILDDSVSTNFTVYINQVSKVYGDGEANSEIYNNLATLYENYVGTLIPYINMVMDDPIVDDFSYAFIQPNGTLLDENYWHSTVPDLKIEDNSVLITGGKYIRSMSKVFKLPTNLILYATIKQHDMSELNGNSYITIKSVDITFNVGYIDNVWKITGGYSDVSISSLENKEFSIRLKHWSTSSNYLEIALDIDNAGYVQTSEKLFYPYVRPATITYTANNMFFNFTNYIQTGDNIVKGYMVNKGSQGVPINIEGTLIHKQPAIDNASNYSTEFPTRATDSTNNRIYSYSNYSFLKTNASVLFFVSIGEYQATDIDFELYQIYFDRLYVDWVTKTLRFYTKNQDTGETIYINTGFDIVPGISYFIALTYKQTSDDTKTEFKIYINGDLINTYLIPSYSGGTTSVPLRIKENTYDNFYMSNFSIYESTLTQWKINRLYNLGAL